MPGLIADSTFDLCPEIPAAGPSCWPARSARTCPVHVTKINLRSLKRGCVWAQTRKGTNSSGIEDSKVTPNRWPEEGAISGRLRSAHDRTAQRNGRARKVASGNGNADGR